MYDGWHGARVVTYPDQAGDSPECHGEGRAVDGDGEGGSRSRETDLTHSLLESVLFCWVS